MVFRIFSIYDEKAKAFLPPFFMHEKLVAIRAFSDCVNDSEHQFGMHPSDYTLFEFGDFDDSSGSFAVVDKQPVCNGVEVINSSEDLDETA